MQPDFITSIEAKTALETPQILLEWGFDDSLTTPLSSVLWLWENVYIRRSNIRYPEDITEGDSVLSEAYSTDPTTTLADTSVSDLDEYYYSLFFKYIEHSSSIIGINHDISRLGSSVKGVSSDTPEVIVTGIDGSTTASSADFDSAGSTFLTDGIQAGYYFEIDEGGADDGFYRIDSVNSETQVTLDSALTLTASSVDFNIYDYHKKYWIIGYDFKNKPTIWLWNTASQLVDQKVDLSEILSSSETIVSFTMADLISSVKYLAFCTNSRYIRIPVVDTPEDSDIVEEFDFSGKLTPGFSVTGSTFISGSIYVLDTNNQEIKKITESTGTVTSTYDLSGIDGIDTTIFGLGTDGTNLYVGANNYIYGFLESVTSPDSTDIDYLMYARDILDGDLDFVIDLESNRFIVVVNDTYKLLHTYDEEVGREYLWQQPFVSDENTIALYHLDESSGAPQDSSAYANHGVNNGMTQDDSNGRYDGSVEADAVTEYIDLSAISGEFDDAEGSVSLWFKMSDPDNIDTGTHVVFNASVDASNFVRIQFDSGALEFEYMAGGTSKLVTATIPNQDEEFHHYLITWSVSNDEVKAYVDGVQFGSTLSSLGTWAGTVSTVTIGDSTAAALGYYDEVHISDIARTVHAVVEVYTDANKMHAFSGRDYTETYDNSLDFYYRDEIFTEKFFGGDFYIRNDYEKAKLHPPNNVISENSEIIFRDTVQPILGDVGRLSRLVGLFLDRIADNREEFLNIFDYYKIDIESIPKVANYLGIVGLDTENWNVDKQRRYLRLMHIIQKRGGRVDSYPALAYLLGFEIIVTVLNAKRRWDSVHYNANFDSSVQAINFDEMGSFDTFDQYFPLSFLKYRIYTRSTRSITGVTSVPASRLLTDTSATFTDTAKIGNLIKVKDLTDTGDNGDYIIEEIHSDTVLKVDQDWPVGSLTSLLYTNSWEVPFPDPYVDFLLNRFRDIAPNCMKLMHIDDVI
jgi:hypothetical protein